MAKKKEKMKTKIPEKDKKSAPATPPKAEKSGGKEKAAPRVRRGWFLTLCPYLLILLAVILAICLVVVHLLENHEGVGSVGYALQWLFAGLLGGATPFLPVLFGYIGVLWCCHTIRWKDSEMTAAYTLYRKAKKRLIFRSIMASLVVLTIFTE